MSTSVPMLILSLVINISAIFTYYAVEAMLLHCFYNEEITITKKRALIVFIIICLIEAISFVSGYYFAEVSKADEETSKNRLEAIITIISYVMMLASLVCIIFRRGIGVKKFICRYLVAVFVYFIVSYNFGIISSMIFYCITESTPFLKQTLEVSQKESTADNAITVVSGMLVMLYLYFNYYKKGFTMRPRKIDRVFVVLYSFFILLLFTVFLIAIDNSANKNIDINISIKYTGLRVMIVLAMLVLIIAVPIVMIRGRVNAYYKEVNAYQQTFLETELNASKQYKAAQEDTRAFRHDVQNNLSVVAMLMEQGKIDEAQQYLNDMRTEVNALSPKVVTGDEMVDSIVSSKLAKMEEHGIKFTLDGVIDGGLDWKPMDICTVFANLLDNAIEASSKTDSPFIDLQFKKTDHHRLVRASNSCIEDVDCEKLMSGEAHMTTKENKSLHGYGVGNIRKTVEKYGGMMRLSCADRVFTMELILKK